MYLSRHYNVLKEALHVLNSRNNANPLAHETLANIAIFDITLLYSKQAAYQIIFIINVLSQSIIGTFICYEVFPVASYSYMILATQSSHCRFIHTEILVAQCVKLNFIK